VPDRTHSPHHHPLTSRVLIWDKSGSSERLKGNGCKAVHSDSGSGGGTGARAEDPAAKAAEVAKTAAAAAAKTVAAEAAGGAEAAVSSSSPHTRNFMRVGSQGRGSLRTIPLEARSDVPARLGGSGAAEAAGAAGVAEAAVAAGAAEAAVAAGAEVAAGSESSMQSSVDAGVPKNIAVSTLGTFVRGMLAGMILSVGVIRCCPIGPFQTLRRGVQTVTRTREGRVLLVLIAAATTVAAVVLLCAFSTVGSCWSIR